jgi:glycosyltransferase involved in cell wall biosynthesis
VRILFLCPTGQAGGAEVALVELLAGLRESQPGWSLSLIAASDGPLLARARALGVDVALLPFPERFARFGDWRLTADRPSALISIAAGLRAVWPAWSYARRLRRQVREGAPDVVHTNGLKMHVLGAWVSPARTALVWHVHDYIGRRRLTARLLGWSAHRCSAVVANSRSVADDVRCVCREGPAVHPIWNAVDLTRYSPDGPVADVDALAGLAPAKPGVVRVGLVATFARWKGHRTFLDALALLPPTVACRGYVIGGPLYETDGSQVSLADLRAHAAALHLGERVGFTGHVADSAAAMRALDVVVHASTEPEPFGLVIAEAMACGRPVVAADAGGAAELITAGTNALACPPGDARVLASRIEALAADPALRCRLGDAGRITAAQAFARERMAAEFASIYTHLVHGGERAGAARVGRSPRAVRRAT